MTLRQRLIATSLAVAIPLTGILFVIAESSRQTDMDASIERMLSAELGAGLIDRCEADGGLRPPGGRGGRGGPGGRGGREGAGRGGRQGGADPIELFPFTRNFTSALVVPEGAPPPRSPEFPDQLKEAVARDGRASSTYSTNEGRGLQVAVRIDDTTGPCEILLVRMRPRTGEFRDQVIGLLSILFIVVAAIWLSAGPTIARIRRLAGHVRASAASHYDVPVPETSDDEVGALAKAFNDAGRDVKTHLTEVEAREATLREFVANTAHDIAMPLTVLQGHLAGLERTAGSHNDQAAAHVNAAMRETHYMASLLRNLAAASRLEGGVAVERIHFDLNLIVERVVERHRPLARASGVDVNFAVPEQGTFVDADPTLVEQAIGNLVDNAVRYNRPGGHVAVVLDRVEAGTGRFRLTVEDDGPGVTAEELPRLATRRFRGDAARSRRPDGQGIGLAIAAETMARCGWTLVFRNNTPTGLVAEIRDELPKTLS
jgi:signal transduction histidine kinase